VATAATVQPRIVSRAGWGADERIRGWNDIGYNFLVDRYGRVFEGRYGGITRAVLGAHAGGFNTYTTGVALLGTFTTSRPTSPMLASLERLLAWKLDLTHVDPRGRTVLTSAGGANTRYPAGRRVVVNTILGHRSTSYTTCPGDPTIGLLPRIRSAVSRIGRPKIYGGSATTSRVRPEQGGYAGVHARFSSTARWKVAVTGSNGATVRSFTGAGSEAKVRWNGRTAGSTLAPPGWATMTVTAAAGGATARPVTSRVFVDRTPPPAGSSTGGYSAGAWRVSNVNAEQLSTSAGVFASYRWGRSGDIPVVGDWDGDGTQTVGVVRPNAARNSNHLLLRNSDGSVLDFWYGRHGDRVLVGDWNGDGTWTPSAVRAGAWSLRNSNSTGPADATVSFGRSGDRYLAGDWDGDGDFTPGVQRAGTFWLRNSGGSGPSEVHVRFGHPSDLGFAGDGNGNGTWTPGSCAAAPAST
jgi:N-acetylmuramoyl-L-alanine amidase